MGRERKAESWRRGARIRILWQRPGIHPTVASRKGACHSGANSRGPGPGACHTPPSHPRGPDAESTCCAGTRRAHGAPGKPASRTPTIRRRRAKSQPFNNLLWRYSPMCARGRFLLCACGLERQSVRGQRPALIGEASNRQPTPASPRDARNTAATEDGQVMATVATRLPSWGGEGVCGR